MTNLTKFFISYWIWRDQQRQVETYTLLCQNKYTPVEKDRSSPSKTKEINYTNKKFRTMILDTHGLFVDIEI